MPSDRARAAVARGDWLRAYELLRGRARASDAEPADLDTLAETLVFPIDGACHRPAPDATAFAHREAPFATALGASFPDPADAPANITWTQDYDAAPRPFSQDGSYINFMSSDDPDMLAPNYRRNLERLVAVKRRVDPGNLPLQPQHRAVSRGRSVNHVRPDATTIGWLTDVVPSTVNADV